MGYSLAPSTCYPILWWSFGLGLVNGLGAVYDHIRITHVTGVTTDIGIGISNWLHGRDASKLQLLLPQTATFIICAVTGTYCYTIFGVAANYVPGMLLIVIGVLTLIATGDQSQKALQGSNQQVKIVKVTNNV